MKQKFSFGTNSLLVIAGLLIAALRSVPTYAQSNIDSNCSPPIFVADEFGDFVAVHPIYEIDDEPCPSYDGSRLRCGDGSDGPAFIVDVKTGYRWTIDPDPSVPYGRGGPLIIGPEEVVWCPYDSDLVALTGEQSVFDSTNHNYYVSNLFFYRISTGATQRITPSYVSYYGSSGMQIGPLGPLWGGGTLGWLKGSRPGNDTLLIKSTESPYGSDSSFFYGLYVPQTQALIPMQKPLFVQDSPFIVAVSRDEMDTVFAPYDDTDTAWHFSLQGKEFQFPGLVETTCGVYRIWFSPNDSLVAVEVIPDGYYISPDTSSYFLQSPYGHSTEIWIFRTSDLSKPFHVIDLDKDFCMFSWDNGSMCFLTDSTLAVSMHHDGDSTQPLWEVSIGGKLIRQLTFWPDSSLSVVSGSSTMPSLSLISYPDPSMDQTTFSFSLPSACPASLSLVDAEGRETPLLQSAWMNAGQHEVTWNASNYPSGVYFCRLIASGESVTRRVIVMH